MSENLESFLKWMKDEKLVNLDDITKKDDNGFEARFRVQKCMYMAQQLGLESNYRYNSYLHGPYSTSLADAYYKNVHKVNDNAKNISFKHAKACRSILVDHDNKWLEIASTLIHVANRGETDREKLLARVGRIKFRFSEKYIHDTLDELLKSPLAGVFRHLVS